MASVVPGEKMPPPQIFGLDFLRFFAASTVMVYHLGYASWADPRQHGPLRAAIFGAYGYLSPFIGTGWIGVQIFFVISGFVIAYSANGKSPWSYATSRFLRLVPGLWICASISIPFALMAGRGVHAVTLAYLNSLIFDPFGPKMANAYWTLPLEIFFYALVFVVIFADRFRHIELFAWGLTAWSGVFWLGNLLFADRGGRLASIFAMSNGSRLLLLQHGGLFALGIFLWLATKIRWTSGRVLACVILLVVNLIEITSEAMAANAWAGVWHNPIVPAAVWLVALGVMFLSAQYSDRIAVPLERYKRPIKAIGLATYPLYLIHQPTGEWLTFVLLRSGVPPIAALVIACLFAIAIAFLVAELLEPRFRHVLGGLFHRLQHRLPRRLGTLQRNRAAIYE